MKLECHSEKGLKCGVDEADDIQHQHVPEHDGHHNHDDHNGVNGGAESGAMACYEVIISLACDAGYTSRHGGRGGAQGRMIGILNLVQTNYDNEFRDEIQFLLGPSFVAVGSNPGSWNFSSNSTILSTFRNWGNGGGFGSSAYDVATLWTVQRFGGVIGQHICLQYVEVINTTFVLISHQIRTDLGTCKHMSWATTLDSPTIQEVPHLL